MPILPLLDASPDGLFLGLGTVLVFALFAVAFVVLNVAVLSRILRPAAPHKEKETTYECGEPPVGSSWVRFDMRFYAVGLVFLILDVEVALLYPWALVYRDLTALAGPLPFAEMLFFVVVVGVGFASMWAKGDLDWVKTVTLESARQGRFASPRPKVSPSSSSTIAIVDSPASTTDSPILTEATKRGEEAKA